MLSLIEPFIRSMETGFLPHGLRSWDLTAIVLICLFGVLSSLEFRMPKQARPRESVGHSYQANLSLLAFNSVVISILSVSSLLVLIHNASGAGVLSAVSSPVLKAALSFLLLDVLLYLWHWACHRWDGFWMFHKVHHNDPYLNVSTAFRIHLIELVMTGVLKSFYISFLGIDKKIVLAYETAYTAFVMFHHANISFRGEKILGYLFVTPSLHRSHHSKERAEHDSNYGAIFSFWDRLMRTLKVVEPIAVGIKYDETQSLWGLIKLGFKTVSPAAGQPQNETPAGAGIGFNIQAMIAEAAYYRAEKRSFSPGYELYDWLEAKKEIHRQLCGRTCANC